MGQTKRKRPAERRTGRSDPYLSFDRIDGRHPYGEIPGHQHVVWYRVRNRPQGRLTYFNFKGAKEIGLIDGEHKEVICQKLEKKFLQAFSLQLINEFDTIHNLNFPANSIKKNPYMATRYVQLQHRKKDGSTSGDGRGIWNGFYRGRGGRIWDISSCGTGATRLSPATSSKRKFFKTGDPSISYGCGLADLSDGLAAAIMSEIFHRQKIPTERTLGIIEYSDGTSINVRFHENLLRPSHLFLPLKQGNSDMAKDLLNYAIKREAKRGSFELGKNVNETYKNYLIWFCHSYAKMAANFESDYIFCWLDWDGDNILLDGGIIDYGSIRQFGLYHSKYRFDDVERWSTTIGEQKLKAKIIVQTMIQLVEFARMGKKTNLKEIKRHKLLNEFDSMFNYYKRQNTLRKVGFKESEVSGLLHSNPKIVERFYRIYHQFERVNSSEGPIEVSDGVTENAIYCLRDFLRLMPKIIKQEEINLELVHQEMISSYASKTDRQFTPYRKKKTSELVEAYGLLIQKGFQGGRDNYHRYLRRVDQNAQKENRYDRVTGDSIIMAMDYALKKKKKLTRNSFQKLLVQFIDYQSLIEKRIKDVRPNVSAGKAIEHLKKIIIKLREGL